VTRVARWLLDVAFASPPQSGLAWFCFLFPLKSSRRFRQLFLPICDLCENRFRTVCAHRDRETTPRLGTVRIPRVGECADKPYAWPPFIRDKNRMR